MEAPHPLEKLAKFQGKTVNTLQTGVPSMLLALKALILAGIPVVEYGAQIYHRSGDKRYYLLNPEWVIPDDQLPGASQILVEAGYPRVFPSVRPWVGWWDTRSWCHDIKMPEHNLDFGVVYLLPLSIVGFSLADTARVPCSFDDSFNILTPKPVAYCVSLVKLLRGFEVDDARRFRVQADLMHFICHAIDQIPMEATPYIVLPTMEQKMKTDNGIRTVIHWQWGKTDILTKSIILHCVRDPQMIWRVSKNTNFEGGKVPTDNIGMTKLVF
ncbi:hypothetical protein N7490_011678 [Penicillium lividum]|nr:hypothetical protein N7490_011678 [Penicillium lividum]